MTTVTEALMMMIDQFEMIEGRLDSAEVRALLQAHLQDMAMHSPPQSVHALDLSELSQPDVRFWGAWGDDDGELFGCIALKELDSRQAEIKSMRTAVAHLRKGVANKMLSFVISVAKDSGYRDLFLETGSMAAFEPARKMYEKSGFRYCEPFADYRADPNSVFMRMSI